MKNRVKKVSYIGLLSALALIMSYIEALLPPLSMTFPGIKVGLANIIIIYTLYRLDIMSAFTVSFIRLTLSALLFGNSITFVYSAAGALLSLSVMWLIKRLDFFSAIGVSILGGIFHNVGQITVAIIILENSMISYYFLPLFVSGTIAGVFIGILATLAMRHLDKFIIKL